MLRARRRSIALVAAIVGLAAVVRFWALNFGLPHTQTRPDETQIIDVTLAFLRGNFKPPFYDYPWLYMWVLTGLYLGYFLWGFVTGAFHGIADLAASWPAYWTPFFLISRALSAACGTATVFLVYRLGRTLWDESTGLVAAFFLSLAFLHVRDSHFGTTDTAMTLLIVGAVLLLIEAHRSGRHALYMAAGAVGGLASATKYNALLLMVVVVAAQLTRIIDAPGRRLRVAFDSRLLSFGLPFVVALAIGMPFVIVDFSGFSNAMSQLRDSMQKGTGYIDLEIGWVHHLKLSLRYGLGWPLLATGFAGALLIVVREPRVAALLLAFPVSYYLVAGSVRNLFFRYVIPIVPFLCLTASRFVTVAVRAAARKLRAERPTLISAATAAAAALVVLPSAISTVAFDRILAAADNRVLIADWIKKHIPPGDSILQSGSPYGYVQLDKHEYVLWVWDRARHAFVVNGRRATGRPDWILLQDSPLPSTTQDFVKQLLNNGYDFAWQFTAVAPSTDRVYDLQDAFFVPFSGFSGVRRPGPNFTLYKRSMRFSFDGSPSSP